MTSQAIALHELTAADAASLIASREISPVELIQALLDRAAEVDGRVQAWVRLDADRALAAAQAAERAVRDGSELGPLHGVPFGAKDIFDSEGLITSAGFGPYAHRQPERDAEPIRRLKQAGAILLGKLVTTQFAFADPSRSRNPWDDSRTPGGSSSGSAVGVATRQVPMALGSQTAGSVLRPAAYNGVVGFKPTYGRISKAGVLPLAWSLDHVGVITRSVRDCELFLAAASDVPTEAVNPLEEAPRLGIVREALQVASSGTREHLLALTRDFQRAGATVREVSLGETLELILAVHHVTMQTETAAVHWQLLEQYPGGHLPRLLAYVEVGRFVPGVVYVHAQRLRSRIREAIRRSLDGIDALILPTAADVPPGRETTGDTSLQAPFSLVGFPSLSLPSGVADPEGLPRATQLVSLPGEDSRLLRVAEWCESQMSRMPPPPGFA